MSLWKLPLAVAFMALGLRVPVVNAGNEVFLGRWNCFAQSPEGELPAVWVVTEEAGAVVVSVEIDGIVRPAQDVKVDGRTLAMKVTYQSVSYDVSVVFEGDTLAGTWSGDGRQGPLRGKRA